MKASKYIYIGKQEDMMIKKLWDKCEWQLNQNMKYLECFQFSHLHDRLLCMKEAGKFVVPRLVVVATLECTLRCAGCSHLIDLYKERYHFPINFVSNALNNFLKYVDACICIGITGGEPFLYPSLSELISICTEHSKIFFVEITTNATVIPSTEVISSLKRENVLVKINAYSASTKVKELISVFKNHGVKYIIVNDEKSWIDYGDFNKRNRSRAKLTHNFITCPAGSYCKTLFLSHLFHCPRAAFYFGLGDVKFHINQLEVNNDSITIKDIKDFYLQDINSMCDHCDKMEKRMIARGSQWNKIKE